MAKNTDLRKADRNKNDEFYTHISDIEKEMKNYRDEFKDAVVLCNCDDPEYSHFWKYFHLNFEYLGLKKLITTHYHASEPTYKMEYEGGNDVDITVGKITPLKQNGDFRSPECVELLKEATIVVTNPPFSLFREYVAQLIEYDKKFAIIGNMNATTYKEIFPLIRDNKVWYGVSITSGDRMFYVPDDYPLNASACGVDEDGRRFIRVKGVRWFTNLDNQKRHEPLDLIETYNPTKYPKFDNYDAINVDKTLNIPVDYDGLMGVPITFMDKYCPEQFELIDGIGRYSVMHNEETKKAGKYLSMVNGKAKYFRIIIRRKGAKTNADC